MAKGDAGGAAGGMQAPKMDQYSVMHKIFDHLGGMPGMGGMAPLQQQQQGPAFDLATQNSGNTGFAGGKPRGPMMPDLSALFGNMMHPAVMPNRSMGSPLQYTGGGDIGGYGGMAPDVNNMKML